jgi:hypothetical protein
MSRIYKLPVSWEVIATQEVEADSLEEAIMIAEETNLDLPKNSEYLDGSYEVNRELVYAIKKAVGSNKLKDNKILNI